MTNAPAGFGRGAWTVYGGTTPYYQQAAKPKNDVGVLAKGQDPNSYDYRAVHFGVEAIQSTLNDILKPPALAVDGVYGPSTSAAVKVFQALQDWPSGDIDGIVGPQTARALFRTPLVAAEIKYNVPGHYLCGIGVQESELDPGAVGYTTPNDKGLLQWNLPDSGYTAAQAFNPMFAAAHGAQRFMAAMAKFAGKSVNLQIDCSIANHNSPLQAEQWFTTGAAPSVQIANYVGNVVGYAAKF